MKRFAYTVVYEKDENGYVVTVPALPGIVTEGRTLEEARLMAADAIKCHLESLVKDGEPVPVEQEVNLEKVEVEVP